MPNDLLVPLGSFRFEVDRLRSEDKPVQVVAARAPLVIITTNEERDLPRPSSGGASRCDSNHPRIPGSKQIARPTSPAD